MSPLSKGYPSRAGDMASNPRPVESDELRGEKRHFALLLHVFAFPFLSLVSVSVEASLLSYPRIR